MRCGSNPPSGGSTTPHGENLDDPKVPLVPAPGDGLVEIPDEEPPLVDVPKTGDASMLWLAMSALSGAGLFLSNKKRKDEE